MLILYSFTIFLAAALLMVIQPLMGKLLLPESGGSAALWNSCLLFFQLMVLGGYSYVHLLWNHKWKRKNFRIVIFQLLIIGISLWFLPYGAKVTAIWPNSPVIWSLTELFRITAIPVFILASCSPLLQCWFTSCNHSSSSNPYFLYAAGNAGSLLGLLIYPFLLEPTISLAVQLQLWSVSYWILFLLIAIAAFMTCSGRLSNNFLCGDPLRQEKPSFKISFIWGLAAFIPSSLLISFSEVITIDIAPWPFLWVLPLSLYLLTWIIAFSRSGPDYNSGFDQMLAIIVRLGFIALIIVHYSPQALSWQIKLLLYPLTLFLVGLFCHRQLVRTRPPIEQLTWFYLMISLGGVLGGALNTLLAPLIFQTRLEIPLVIILTCWLTDKSFKFKSKSKFKISTLITSLGLGLHLGVVIWLLINLSYLINNPDLPWAVILTAVIISILMIRQLYRRQLKSHRQPFSTAIIALMILSFCSLALKLSSNYNLISLRNFFGVKSVNYDPDNQLIQLQHGTTIHGSQYKNQHINPEPLAYYHASGPVGDIFRTLRQLQLKNLSIGAIGLGIGSILYFSESADQFDFFEIDPQIVSLASNPEYFNFLSSNPDRFQIFIGDGRKLISSRPNRHYNLIFLDAFNSDSIPVHLLTVEAFQIYLNKLNPQGALLIHISNRYLDLEPPLKTLARHYNLDLALASDHNSTQSSQNPGKLPSNYALLTDNSDILNWLSLNSQVNWTVYRFSAAPTAAENQAAEFQKVLWTDNYSSLWTVLRR